MQQRVDQRAAGMAGARVDHQAGGFVEHQQPGVFVKHTERNVLRLGKCLLRRRLADQDSLTRAQLERWLDRAVRESHLAGLDQRLEPRPAQVRKLADQEAVEPLAGIRIGDDEGPLARRASNQAAASGAAAGAAPERRAFG